MYGTGNRTEFQRILRQIASFYDESEEALVLLRKSHSSGFINTPGKEVAIWDFLSSQRLEWEERKRQHVAHSLSFLKNKIMPGRSFAASYRNPSDGKNLDEIDWMTDRQGGYRGKFGKYNRD